MKISKSLLIIGLIVVAALTRIMPHPVNFGPLTAIALFTGALLPKRWMAVLAVVLSAMLSDVLVNAVLYSYYDLTYVVSAGALGLYACYAAFIFLGSGLQNPAVKAVAGRSLTASVIFFLVSNALVWASGSMYPTTFGGLMAAYAAGLPFFHYTILGDLVYSGVLFAGFAAIMQAQPAWLKK